MSREDAASIATMAALFHGLPVADIRTREPTPVAEQALQKHTPGPWQSQHDFDCNGELQIIGNVDGPDDGRYHYTCICYVDDGEEASANARLIKAAPDLLEVARVFLAQYPGGINPGLDRARALARATIAKMEGRS